jgi:hypothetical protein
MTPPINIDGSQVSEVTIDGQPVSQVTIDGQDVLSAGPDISMFNSVAAHFVASETSASAGQTGEFPQVATSVGDATAQNSPLFRSGVTGNSGESYAAYEYQGGDDFHDIPNDSGLPSGDTPLSVFVLFKADNSSENRIFEYGTDGTEIKLKGSEYRVNSFQVTNFSGGTTVTGSWATVGFVYRSPDMDLAANGSDSAAATRSDSGSFAADGNIGAGLKPIGNPTFDGHIAEMVICDVAEPLSNYKTYHDSRLS